MKVLGIVGSGAAGLADRLTAELDGDAASVTVTDADGLGPTDAAASYELGADGSWYGTGTETSLESLLDDLATEYEYALVTGAPAARIPTVVLGAASVAGTVLLEADSADAVDTSDVIEALETVEPRVTLGSLVRRAKASPRAERAGAIATFTGRVRARDSPDDAVTTHLAFEKYEGVAGERMRTIGRELEERDGIYEVLMHHRTGVIEYGEDIVFVVVLAGHRTEAFRTVEDGINRLKDEVPIFKKETTVDSEFWVHDRA